MYRSPTHRSVRWYVTALLALPAFWMLSGIVSRPVAAQGGTAGPAAWRSGSLKPFDSWNTFVADMTVGRRQVNAAGALVGVPSPTATYRLERSMASGSWKSVLTVLSMERTTLYSLDGLLGSPAPLAITRIEDDEDGTPLRAFDSLGRRLRLPDLASPGGGPGTAQPGAGTPAGFFATATDYRVANTSWIDSFVAASANAAARQLALEKEFGKPTSLNGLTRFAKTVGSSSEEVLVQPTSIIPVESNVSENTTLMAHRTFTYRPAYEGALVRARVHSEQRLSVTNSDRLVSDTSFANVALERR